MKEKFAAQLYTLREELKRDFPNVLRELKQMGWPAVQISGLHGYEPGEIAGVLEETGLKTAGIHIGLDVLRQDLDGAMDQARIFKTKDIICPFLPPEFRSEEGFQKVKQLLNEIAGKAALKGYRISYHNHAFEFETTIDGKSALEYLLEPTADNKILAEIDVYWVKKGGANPLEFIQPYGNRMPIIHLKDMTNDERQDFASVGTGSIDFPPILDWCEQNGVEWYAVEQDVCPGNPMDSLQTSLENLNRFASKMQTS